MIDGNIIKFGYGDILVGSILNCITIVGIDKAFEPGMTFSEDNVKFITDTLHITFNTIIQITSFRYSLLKLEKSENKIFEYGGWIFDFTNYNQKSVDVVLSHLDNVFERVSAMSAV